KGGRKTLPILLGRERAVATLAFLFLFSYLWIVVIVLMGYVSPWLLIMFLGLKKPISAIIGFRHGENDPRYMSMAMKSTALTNTNSGLLLSVGLLIGYLF